MSAVDYPGPTRGDEVVLSKEDVSSDEWRVVSGFISTSIDRDGNPIGLQIDDGLPKDHPLYRAGFRGGDLVKSINGTPIREIQAAKNLILKLRDEGVTAFVIGFERHDAERVKYFRVVEEK